MALMPGLTTSLSGMKTAQAQLEIVSRNIANVDTVGYTRKIAQQLNYVKAGSSMGVTLGDVTRQVNEGLLKSYLASNSTTGNLSATSEYLGKAEVFLGTPQGDNSIAANIASLQTAFDSFASDVTSASNRYGLLNQAQSVTARLNSLSASLQQLRGDADLAISESVDEINDLLENIDRLNEEIVKYDVLNYDGKADLLDERDQALRDLSEKIDITYFKRESGAIVIQTTGGITLLDSEPHKLSHSATTQASSTINYASGEISGIYVDGKDITTTIKDGELKGLIDVRDTTLSSLQSQLDELAGTLKDSINQIHNQGTAYPSTPSEMSGTQTFIDPDTQRISVAEGDVRFVIFDSEGNQVATTNLKGGIGFESGTLTDMASEIQAWMRSADGANLPQAEVYFDAEGKLNINTGDSNYTISIIDEASSTPGSAQQDAVLQLYTNGDDVADRTFEGFSSMFGLNDFFVSDGNESIYDSKVMSLNSKLGINENTVLSFYDSRSGLVGTLTVTPNDSLQDIVNNINNDPDLSKSIRASLVPNGSGYMLRIENRNGDQMEICENIAPGETGSNILTNLGLAPSNVNVASSIKVREELEVSPELIAGGSPSFNTSTGKYTQSSAANDIALKMGEVFSATHVFKQSGTLGESQTTLANYASSFVGNIASQASTAESDYAYQAELTNSISTKEAEISGVDIDEELGQLIIFQQTYAANAQAFTASKEILDMLLNIV